MKLPRCLRPVGWMPEKMIGAGMDGSLFGVGTRMPLALTNCGRFG